MKIPLDSLGHLEQALLDFQTAYEATSDRTARQALRTILIRAKTKARLSAQKAKRESKRTEKTEMALWILTWLENPLIFREWIQIRKAVTSAQSP